MTFKIIFHETVADEDLPRLSSELRKRIIKTIDRKLALHPQEYGQALRGSLAGLWRLRVGSYRIIYVIRGAVVEIAAIGPREHIYEMVARRMPGP